MAAWASPLHFRVHAAYRTGTKLRTELQREDEQKWEWVLPKSAQSAGSSDTRPDKEKWERAGPKTEAASNTAAKSAGSDEDKQQLDRAKPKNETASDTGSFQGAPWCGKAEPKWQSWQPVPWQCNLKTPSASLSLWDWLTPATVTSTATQTLDDGRSLHQWRSIQEQYWLELQKVQHNIQSALNKRRDAGRSLHSHSLSDSDVGTDAGAPSQHRSGHVQPELELWEEIVRSSKVRARKAAPKKRRPARRNRMRPVKQACSDTIEESIPSTDEVAPQRKRARVYKGSPPSSTTRITFNTSFHPHIIISHSNNSTSHLTILHECGTVSWSVLNSFSARSKQNKHQQ